MKRFVGWLSIAAAASCGPLEPPPSTGMPLHEEPPAPVRSTPPRTGAAAQPAHKSADPVVVAMARRVSRARGLPVRKPIANKVIARDEILGRIRAHVEREIPRDVLTHQGEALAALELVPPSYDFVAGVYALLQGRIAGFYEPDDRTMYLVDDLDDEEAEETLAHELVHALQDQSFGLKDMLDYAPGDSDRVAAAHALAEGDAMSAMLDVTVGSAFRVDEGVLRFAFQASTMFSSTGAKTPPALQASLTAAYTDGFRFVQALRTKGDWPMVDAAWKSLPASTEQVLHPDKYDKREPPIRLAPAEPAALGPDYKRVLDDVMGEQGLRITLEDWSSRRRAETAAAGWGGDRYVVARSDAVAGAPRFAIAWHIRMDTPADAREVAQVLEDRFGKRCKQRADLGPVAWSIDGADLVIVAGPYGRAGTAPTSAGACSAAEAWVKAVLSRK